MQLGIDDLRDHDVGDLEVLVRRGRSSGGTLGISADIIEKQVTERHMREALGDGAANHGSHLALVRVMRAGRGDWTLQTGNSSAAACASSRSIRTACIATRRAGALMVVSSAPIPVSPRARSTWSIQALSLPALQDTMVYSRFGEYRRD